VPPTTPGASEPVDAERHDLMLRIAKETAIAGITPAELALALSNLRAISRRYQARMVSGLTTQAIC